MGNRHKALSLAAAVACAALSHAQVRFDGSLGAPGELTGPNIVIPADRGRLRGSNLFHSFSDFNVAANQSARFAGPASVKNVLARVTGGSPSQINGVLGNSIANANTYLINPAGVIFGDGARLDMTGSLVVTSANSLKFSDGSTFAAQPGATDELLSTASVAQFGFLGSAAGGIRVAGSTANATVLRVAEGKTISLIGGEIVLERATIKAVSGKVNLLAAGAESEVSSTGLADEADTAPTIAGPRSNIAARGGAVVDVDGQGGGSIHAIGDAVKLEDTQTRFSAQTFGPNDGKGIVVDAGDFQILGKAGVLTDTYDRGRGGPIAILAKTIVLDGLGEDADVFGISAQTSGIVDDGVNPAGAGGDINITVGDLTIRNSSRITTESRGVGGNGGNVFIAASGDISIDASGDPNLGATITGITTRVKEPDRRVDAGALPNNTGLGGSIDINCANLALVNGARISADTQAKGTGGTVNISAFGDVSISGLNTQNPDPASQVASQIVARSRRERDATTKEFLGLPNAGPAGSINISAGRVIVGLEGLISTSTQTSSPGGAVLVDARRVEVARTNATIASQTFLGEGGGNAGTVTINAGTVTVARNGRLAVNTFGSGDGGRLDITADVLQLSTLGHILAESGIVDDQDRSGLNRGRGAGVTIHAGSISLTSGGRISTNSFGDGRCGSLFINTNGGSIFLDGSESNQFTGFAGSTRNTVADIGRGGDIDVRSGDLSIHGGAKISSSSVGPGRGGNVSIEISRTLSIDDRRSSGTSKFSSQATGIIAETQDRVRGGAGGNIVVTANRVEVLAGGVISSNSFAPGAGGTISISANRSLLLDGMGRAGAATGITAIAFSTLDPDKAGGGGNILIDMPRGDVIVRSGASIEAGTRGNGAGGDIAVTANRILLDGRFGNREAGRPTGISAASRGGFIEEVSLNVTAQLEGPENGRFFDLFLTPPRGREMQLTDDLISAPTFVDVRIIDSGLFEFPFDVNGEPIVGDFRPIENFGALAGRNAGGPWTIRVRGDFDVTGQRLGTLEQLSLNINGRTFSAVDSTVELVGGSYRIAVDPGLLSRGAGGDVSINANHLDLLNGARITADTAGAGAGGSVSIITPKTGSIGMDDGLAKNTLTAIAARSTSEANGTFPSGVGGSIKIDAGVVQLLNRSEITAATEGTGAGGSISLDAQTLRARGGLIRVATGGSGAAGLLRVVANNVNFQGVGKTADNGLRADTTASGNGGAIDLQITGPMSLRGATISSESTGTGVSGAIDIRAGSFSMRGDSQVAVSSSFTDAGDINLNAGAFLSLLDDRPGAVAPTRELARSGKFTGPRITASAGGNGGDINIQASDSIVVRRGLITARTEGTTGGRIDIDPDVVVFDRSFIDGSSNGTPVPVIITAGAFLSADTTIDTAAPQFTIDSDIVGQLIPIEANLASAVARLVDSCQRQFADVDQKDAATLSSFIAEGRGGVSLSPGAPIPVYSAQRKKSPEPR